MCLHEDGEIHYYLAEFYGLQINSTLIEDDVDMQSVIMEPRSMAIDSGTSLFLLDTASFIALQNYFENEYSDLPGINSDDSQPNIFSVSLANPESCLLLSTDYDWSLWPTIDVLLDSVTVSIPAPLYFIETQKNTQVIFLPLLSVNDIFLLLFVELMMKSFNFSAISWCFAISSTQNSPASEPSQGSLCSAASIKKFLTMTRTSQFFLTHLVEYSHLCCRCGFHSW